MASDAKALRLEQNKWARPVWPCPWSAQESLSKWVKWDFMEIFWLCVLLWTPYAYNEEHRFPPFLCLLDSGDAELKRAAVRNGVDLMVNIIFTQKSCWQIGWTPEYQPCSKVPSQGAPGCLGKVENAGIKAVRGVRWKKWGFQTQVRVRKVFSSSACPPLIPLVCEFCARASSWCHSGSSALPLSARCVREFCCNQR